MGKWVIVLAVPHRLQGPAFQGYINDPSYSHLLTDLIETGCDFVFEEASGLGPSTAENLAKSLLGPHHYLDVDPPVSERYKYDIGQTGGGYWIEPGISEDFYESAVVEENGKREKLWLQRLEAQNFSKGLMICGLCHGLSFAFRLSSVGISVEKSHTYIPYHKFCTRPHAELTAARELANGAK